MTDILTRLRMEKRYMPTYLAEEAADEIERLRMALQICASHSESSNYQGALSYVRKIARRALEGKR